MAQKKIVGKNSGIKYNPDTHEEVMDSVSGSWVVQPKGHKNNPGDITHTEMKEAADNGVVGAQQSLADYTPPQEEAPQEPTNPKAPLGATWQERIKNATASDDDIRQSFEAYQRGEYTPGPKTLQEYEKMGLTQPAQPVEQPAVEATQEQPAEADQEQSAVEATQEQPAEQPQQEETPTAADGNAEPLNQQEQQTANEVQQEVQSKTDDELKDYLNSIEQSLKGDADKQKLAGIFEAYKNGDIDKNQRNYFLADAIARFVNNIAEIQDTKNQNALWANIASGNQKSANIDLSPNEWQQHLKTNWAAAQQLKNEAKSKATMDKIQTDMDMLRQQGLDKYLYNDFPDMVKNSTLMKMDPNERTAIMALKAANNGAPLNADQLGNVLDPLGNAALGNAMGDAQLSGMILGNELQNAELVAQNITNRVQEKWADKFAEQEFRSAEEAIKAIQKDNDMKDLLKAAQQLDNKLQSDTYDSKVRKAKGEAVNTLYGNAGVALKIAGIGEINVPVSAVVNGGEELVNAIKNARSMK